MVAPQASAVLAVLFFDSSFFYPDMKLLILCIFCEQQKQKLQNFVQLLCFVFLYFFYSFKISLHTYNVL